MGTLITFTVDMGEFFLTDRTSEQNICLAEPSINKGIDYFDDEAHKAAAMAALQCLARSSRLPDGGVRVIH